MTDLELFQEFLHRFNLKDDISPAKTINNFIVYQILLRDASDKEKKGLLNFVFDARTGEYIDGKPYLDVSLEEQLEALDYEKTITAIRFLLNNLEEQFQKN